MKAKLTFEAENLAVPEIHTEDYVEENDEDQEGTETAVPEYHSKKKPTEQQEI